MKIKIIPYAFSSLILLPFCAGASIYSVDLSVHTQAQVKNSIPADWLMHCTPHGLWLLAVLNGYQLLFTKHTFLKKWVWLTAMTSIAIMGQFIYSVSYDENPYGIVNMLIYEYAFVLSAAILAIRDLKTIFY